ncbi:MAG: hypothetical protein FWC45_01635, partial [Treponema sp.]|nr:hypothetical protein [Treponema sp.]
MKSPCSRSPFRSADEWKSALMTLPDNSFFELLRSVFGNIKTPFNKQRLLEDLFIFLSRDDIRKIIAGYINEQDHKVIAAVALLDEPVPAELDDFFDGDISRAELYSLVLNLEERLILYRFRDEGLLHLALNPVLEPVLAPVIADIRPLFPGFFAEQSPDSGSGNSARGPESAGEGHAVACIPDGRTLAALFVFVSAEEELFKAEGEIRKKVLDEGKKFFPRLDLELAVMVLLRLGLFEKESGERPCVMPCRERAEEYSRLSAAEQEAYWAAGVYLCLNEAEDSDAGNLPFRFSRSRLRGIASFVYRFRPLLDPGKLYHRITLKRLAKLLGKEEGEPFSLRSSGG